MRLGKIATRRSRRSIFLSTIHYPLSSVLCPLFAICYLLFASNAFAGFFDNSPGKTGFNFLLLPLTPSSLFRGVADYGIANLEKNPASIWEENLSFEVSQLNYFEGLKFNSAKLSFNFQTTDAFGENPQNHYLAIGIRDFSETDEKREAFTGIKTGNFNITSRAIFLSWALKIGKTIYGITGKSVSQKIETDSLTGVCLDFGLLKDIKNFTIGASVLNIGSKISGNSFPTTLNTGVSYFSGSNQLNLEVKKTSFEKEKILLSFGKRINFITLLFGIEKQNELSYNFGVMFELKNFDFSCGFSSKKYLGVYQIYSINFYF